MEIVSVEEEGICRRLKGGKVQVIRDLEKFRANSHSDLHLVNGTVNDSSIHPYSLGKFYQSNHIRKFLFEIHRIFISLNRETDNGKRVDNAVSAYWAPFQII